MPDPDSGGFFTFTLLVALSMTHTLGLLSACASPRVDPGIRGAVNSSPVPVIVELRLDRPFVPEGTLPGTAAIVAQRQAIETAQNTVLSALHGTRFSVAHRYTTTPFLALTIGPDALDVLERRDDVVTRVMKDTDVAPPTPPRPPSPPTTR